MLPALRYCGGGRRCGARDDAPFYLNSFDKTPSAAALTAIGRALFFDPGLSASGALACASCHDPKHAFASPNGRAVQRGGADRGQPGVRAVPSLMYEQNMPPFTEHFFDSDERRQRRSGTRRRDAPGTGARSPRTSRRGCRCCPNSRWPILRSDAVVAKVARAPYAAQFRRAFGASVFDDRSRAFKAVLLALETFEESPADFYPYEQVRCLA
jgi:cytochrome c peroxidase